MKLLLFIASIATLLSQPLQTPLTVLPGPGTATGEIRLRERSSFGTHTTGFLAPPSLVANVPYTLPAADGTIGQALVTNGGGALSWSSIAGNTVPACASTNGTDAYTCTVAGFTAYSTSYCIVLNADVGNTGAATIDISGVGAKSILRYGGSALVTNDILGTAPVFVCYDGTAFQIPPSASPGSGAFLDGGNSFGAAATLGTNDAYNLIFERGGVPLVELSDTTFNIAPAGVANFATRVTKLDIGDISGAGGIWDIQATGSFISSSGWKLRDNGGGRAIQINRAILGTRLNDIGLFGNVIPVMRAIANGDDVDDTDLPNLGSPSDEWKKAYITELHADQLSRSIFPTPTNTIALGSSSQRLLELWSGTGNFSGTVTATGLNLNTAAPPAVTDCWVATDTVGAGEWGPCANLVVASRYDWIRTIAIPGAAGTHTITLTPGPLGVDAADTTSQYWLTDTVGGSEAVSSTGTGTCDGTALASCTIEVVTAGAHTGVTTIRSGSDGAQESIMAQASGARVTLTYAASATCRTWEVPVFTNSRNVTFQGEGYGSCISLATSGQVGIWKNSANEMRVDRMRIVGPVDYSTTAIFAHAPVANGGSDWITANWFQYHAKAVQHRSVAGVEISGNTFYPSTVQIEAGNEWWPDQGGLRVSGNDFLSDDTAGSKAVWLHGLSAVYIDGRNSFLGADDAVYMDFRMGLVDVTNGSATVTAAAGFQFDPALLTAGVGVDINGVSYTITGTTTSTTFTLSTVYAGATASGVEFGTGTSQIYVVDNNFDNARLSSVKPAGTTSYTDLRVTDNHMQRIADNGEWAAVDITNNNTRLMLDVSRNTISNFILSSGASASYGIRAIAIGIGPKFDDNTFSGVRHGIHLSGLNSTFDRNFTISKNSFEGREVDTTMVAVYVEDGNTGTIGSNKIARHNKGIVIDGAATSAIEINKTHADCYGADKIVVDVLYAAGLVSVDGVHSNGTCTYLVQTGVVANVLAGAVSIKGITGTAATAAVSLGGATIIHDQTGTTYAGLPANAMDSSVVWCSDCKKTAATGYCAASGSGAWADRMNSQWHCERTSGAPTGWQQGGNAYGATGVIGTTDNYDISFLRNNAQRMKLESGALTVLGGSGANGIVANHGTSGNTAQFTSESTYSLIGTFANAPFLLYSDSTARWGVLGTGHLTPWAHDTYDIADSTTRVRGVYAGFGEFWKSGGTGSSDYVKTRKTVFLDNTGTTGISVGEWDFQCLASGLGAFQESYCYMRDSGGGKAFQIERVRSGSAVDRTYWYTDLHPDTNVGQSIGTSVLRWNDGFFATLNTNTLIVNNTVSSTLNPTTTNWYSLGDAALQWADVRSVLGNYSGLLTTAGLTINTGAATVGHIWTATSIGGAGSWQAPAGVMAPLTLTLGASGYSVPLVVRNDTVGLNGSCIELAGHDSGATVYSLGRLCAKFDSALFTDELVSLQTVTGSGTWETAMTWKNQEVRVPGTMVITGDVSSNAGFTAISGAGDYGRFRKLEVHGDGTGTLFDYFSKATTNSIDLRNTAGTLVMRWDSTAATPDVSITGHFWPGGGSGTKSNGLSIARWSDVYSVLGNYSGLLTTAGLTINTGAATVGYVWTATSTGGAGSWQAPGGGSAPPFVDTTAIIKGSGSANKLLAIEVDGFTDFTTRTLTPQNASYTIAGTNLAQTFSADQTFGANILEGSATTHTVGTAGVQFLANYSKVDSAEEQRIVNPSSSHSVYWNLILSSSTNLRLTSGSGSQIETDISVLSSSNTQYGIRGTIYPLSSTGANGDIGYSGLPWRSQYLSTAAYMNGTQWMDSSRNLTNLGTATFGGSITANGGISTGSATNSTMYVGSGNLYIRAFSGSDASCGGVTDGWIGIRTDTAEIQMCSGGALKKVSLI